MAVICSPIIGGPAHAVHVSINLHQVFDTAMDVARDIKLENTLLNFSAQGKPLVKICDFGFTKSVDSGAPHTKLGTMSYTGIHVQ